MDWKLQTDIRVIHYYIEQNFWNVFLVLVIHIRLNQGNALKNLGECITLLWFGWLKRLTVCYCYSCPNELFSVLQEICVQRTLMNSILLILCFCFALHCSSLWCLFCKCTTFFLPCVVFKAEMPLTVFHCHKILIENVCRLSCKSMLPTMFIKMCVKLKYIHLASYVEVQKLTSKVNAALW